MSKPKQLWLPGTRGRSISISELTMTILAALPLPLWIVGSSFLSVFFFEKYASQSPIRLLEFPVMGISGFLALSAMFWLAGKPVWQTWRDTWHNIFK